MLTKFFKLSVLKTSLICVLFLIISIFFTACNNFDTQSESLEEVNLVLDWTPNTNHTGIYVADKLGYFEQEGIKLNIIQPPEDGATSLVGAGKTDFGIDFQDYLAPAFLNNVPVTAVAAIIEHNSSGFVSLKNSNIDSPKNFEGKNYTTQNLPAEIAIINYIMEKNFADINKLNFIPTTVTDIASALNTNIDIAWIYYAWDGIALENLNIDTNFMYLKDIDEIFDFYTPVLIANNDFLENRPELAKRFMSAVSKGYQYAMQNPKESADILTHAVPELDYDLVLKSQLWLSEKYSSNIESWGYIDKSRWDNFYNWLYEKNIVSEKISDKMCFSNDFLPSGNYS